MFRAALNLRPKFFSHTETLDSHFNRSWQTIPLLRKMAIPRQLLIAMSRTTPHQLPQLALSFLQEAEPGQQLPVPLTTAKSATATEPPPVQYLLVALLTTATAPTRKTTAPRILSVLMSVLLLCSQSPVLNGRWLHILIVCTTQVALGNPSARNSMKLPGRASQLVTPIALPMYKKQ